MNLKICVTNSCFILLKLVTPKKENNGIAVACQEREKAVLVDISSRTEGTISLDPFDHLFPFSFKLTLRGICHQSDSCATEHKVPEEFF